jgi:cytochrome P450 family 6
LRKWPPIPQVQRTCIKDYKIPNTDIVVEEGISIAIPIYSIHHDKNIYDNPEEYNPDRFSPSEKAKRHQFSFLPFGEGNFSKMHFGRHKMHKIINN